MEKIYENKIFLGDCVEILKNFKEKSIDVCFTDIPFNVNLKYNKYNDSLPNEIYFKKCKLWFKTIGRVCKTTIMRIPIKHLPRISILFNEYIGYKWMYICYCPNSCSKGYMFRHLYEVYLISGLSKKVSADLFKDTSIYKIKTNHPAETSYKRVIKILSQLTKPDDVIIDPFMGTGTTMIACKILQRKFIGVEIDEYYFDIAKKRINGNYSIPDNQMEFRQLSLKGE